MKVIRLHLSSGYVFHVVRYIDRTFSTVFFMEYLRKDEHRMELVEK